MSIFSENRFTRYLPAEDYHRYETVVFWGAGRKVPSILAELVEERAIIPPPDYITDSTRDIGEYEFGIPSLPFPYLRNLDPEKTLIVVTAGLLDLQAHVIRNELYYHRIVDHTALEHQAFLRDNPDAASRASAHLFDNDSRQLFDELLFRRTTGILWSPDLFSPNPYFGNQIVPRLPSHGTVIYAGAYQGRQVQRMLESSPEVRIRAFEPSSKWSVETSKRFEQFSNVSITQAVLTNETGIRYFYEDLPNGGMSARLYDSPSPHEERTQIPAISVDQVIDEGEMVSQIILDVEGEEEKVLFGARQAIAASLPTLTICNYHSPTQFFDVIEAIREVGGDSYDVRILHHSCVTTIESVIYATRKTPNL